MSLHDRIKEARKNKGLTQEQLGELIGVAKTTITGYEKNREPTAAKVGEIADALGVDVNFLFQDEVTKLHENKATSDEMEHLVKKYRSLDVYGKAVVDLILESELHRTKEQKKNVFVREHSVSYLCSPVERNYPQGIYQIDDFKNDEENRISMPVYDLGASAGTGVFLDNPCYEVISMPEDKLSRKANFALWVSGNSMEPRFHDGDLVLVKIQPNVEIGEIGIFVLNGEGYIKKFGGDKLVSLNPAYEPIMITEDDAVYCKGKVIGNI